MSFGTSIADKQRALLVQILRVLQFKLTLLIRNHSPIDYKKCTSIKEMLNH